MTGSPTISARKVERGGPPARIAAVKTGTCSASDPCATEEIWRPWQICVTPEGSGESGFRRRYIRTSGVEPYWDTFEVACRLLGLSPPDSLVFLVPVRLGPRARYWHRPAGKDQLSAMHPGGVDWTVDSGQCHVMVLVKYALLHRRLGEEFCEALEDPAGTHCVPSRPGEVRRLGEWAVPIAVLIDRPYTATDLGVHVRVLTNSLAANDLLAAHADCAGRRKQVLEGGVELYELRADAGVIRKRIAYFGAKAALHAKVVVFDRKDVSIDSFNLDPRSADLNTQAGLYVESPESAAQVVAWMDEGVRPENSYRVLLDDDGDIEWVTEYEGKAVRLHTDPESTRWQRFVTGLIGILPVENQL